MDADVAKTLLDAKEAMEGILELVELDRARIMELTASFTAQQTEMGLLKHRVALLEEDLKQAKAAIMRMQDDKRTEEFARSRGVR